MSMINDYQKGWALRYLREAKAELTAAKKSPYMAPSLILEAAKKAQAAIYYSLGDPISIETIVHQTINKKQLVNDPTLKYLVNVEKTIRNVARTAEAERKKAFKQADDLIQTATTIVKLFTGEKVD